MVAVVVVVGRSSSADGSHGDASNQVVICPQCWPIQYTIESSRASSADRPEIDINSFAVSFAASERAT